MDNNEKYQNLLRALEGYSKSNPEGFPEIVKAFLERLQKSNEDAYYEMMTTHFVKLMEEVNLHNVLENLVRTLHPESDWSSADYKDAVEKGLRIAEKADVWMKRLPREN